MPSPHIFIAFFFIAYSFTQGHAQVDPQLELSEALNNARASNDYVALADSYFDLALYEEKANRNLDRSFEQLSRSLEYYELLKDSSGIYLCKYHIARQLLQNGMYDDALKRLTDVKEFYEQEGNIESLALVELQLFDYYFEKLDVDNALKTMLEVKEDIAGLAEHDLELELISREIAYNELLQEFALALENANLCYEISLQQEDITKTSKCLLYRGRVQQKLKDYIASSEDIEASLLGLNDVPFSKLRLEAYELLAVNHRRLGMYEIAYDYSERYSALQDSILNENRVIAINNLTYKYESKEKATEIKLLEQDKAFVQKSNQQQKRALIVLGLALLGMLLGVYYIIRFYSEKIKSALIIEEQNEKINEQKINELHDKIRINSMQSMIAGQEVERERIAKDLHDSLGGLLSTIKLQIDNIQDKETTDDKAQEFKHTTDLIDVAVSEIRTISQDLQPGALKRLGLTPAINDLVNRYQTNSGPEITFQHFGLPKEMEQSFAMGIYRIVQEILNNALKHAHATEIFVQLNKEDDDIVIHIEDDGIGFDPDKKYKSMGLENIRSRVNYLKGTMDIDSRLGQGTSFIIHLNSNFDKVAPPT